MSVDSVLRMDSRSLSLYPHELSPDSFDLTLARIERILGDRPAKLKLFLNSSSKLGNQATAALGRIRELTGRLGVEVEVFRL